MRKYFFTFITEQTTMKIFRRFLPHSLLTAVGMTLLVGCEKDAQLVTPKTIELSQNTQNDAKQTMVVAPWASFIEQVELGQATDPLGQYVSKATYVANDKRSSRPSISLEERIVALKEKGVMTYKIPCEDRPDDPDCGGGVTAPLYTFVTSEGVAPYSGIDNPNGYIWDLKIAAVRPGTGNVQPLAGYSLLNADLNKGVGGDYIYLTFTRNPSIVLYGQERGRPYSEGAVTAITTRSIDPLIYTSPPDVPFRYWPIWYPSSNQQYGLSEYDLNQGAGGDYIYSYQSKGGSGTAPIEVGVIYGGDSNIYPPSPWVRNGVNLNKGAGGFYIYFCYKAR